MANPVINETFGQARQGSVAAIIQVLNERLADVGIRTRAVVADGMLQLLCEAATPEQLEKKDVVDQVRHILENISPQRISRVKINSRIVKEEQLLWLEEISRDPENALLWSEIITLKRPFFVQRWLRDRHLRPAGPLLKDISEPEPQRRARSSTLAAGLGLLALLAAAVWLFREDLRPIQTTTVESTAPTETVPNGASDGSLPELPASSEFSESDRTADTTPPSAPASNPSSGPGPSTANPVATTPDSVPGENEPATTDVFAEAVRLAEQAGKDGQSAATTAEWLDLAARWQKASDLMSQVSANDAQYAIAQDRVKTYAENSQAALQKAGSIQ